MGNRLSREKVDAMWLAYSDRQSVDHVSRKCGVHWKTVDRYRQLEKWDERLAKIRGQAQAEADHDVAKALASSLRLTRAYKEQLRLALERKRVTPDEVTASEIERISKLEQFLLGGVEGRQEIVGGRFTGWSNAQLEAYARDGTVPS